MSGEIMGDPRSLTNEGLIAALRQEIDRTKPDAVKRDWVFYPLMWEALSRLVAGALPASRSWAEPTQRSAFDDRRAGIPYRPTDDQAMRGIRAYLRIEWRGERFSVACNGLEATYPLHGEAERQRIIQVVDFFLHNPAAAEP